MAILIDPPAWPAHGTLWSHLVSDTGYDELHAFAARLGVPRRGFDLDHYDVPASLHARAIDLGARAVGAKEIVHRLRESGLRVKQAEREIVAPVRRREFLRTEWASLGTAVGVVSDARITAQVGRWNDLGESLILRWNEPHRRYHDERHLEDVLLSLNQLAVNGERVAHETLLAAWFHDAVYRGASGADEQDSAQLAVASLSELGASQSLTQSVAWLITETVPGLRVHDAGTPLAHLLDADLSIFGASGPRYERYTKAVRLEYAHVPDADFAEARAQILASYLEQPTIYRTDTAKRLWESRARTNLSLEIETLRGGLPLR